MLEGLYSAAAGMSAQQEQLSAIGNDLANLSTSGYQSERVAFSDLLYNPVELAGTSTSVGAGASARVIGASQAQGAIKQTGNPLDVAIEGAGYMQVTLPGGTVALTRNGALGLNAARTLTTAEGDRLAPPITIPAGIPVSAIAIGRDGTVTAEGKTLGQIKLVTVPSPQHLLAAGNGMLSITAASGAARAAGAAQLHQGALEESNVDVAREMALMVTTERSFQMTSSAIQTEGQMMTIANELRPAS
jgi:flagellar basal-body rod protein FlgG